MIARAKSSLVLVGLLLILLPTLAVLQYRWIGDVSAAEHNRMESSLRVASDRFAADFDAEIARLGNAFQIRGGLSNGGGPIVERYQAWSETTPYVRLVRNVYMLKFTGENATKYYRVNLPSGELQDAPLPEDLATLRDRFRLNPFNPTHTETMLLVTAVRNGRPFVGPRLDDFRSRGSNRGPGPGSFGPGGGPGGFGPGGGAGGPGAVLDGALVIELDRDTILKELIPALTERHFSSHDDTDYRVAVVTAEDTPRVLYSSEGEWKSDDIEKPDVAVNLFGGPSPPPPGTRGNGDVNRRGGRSRVGVMRGVFQGMLIATPWQLLAKHRSGSLETAVEQLRRRDLAISFGILLVLGAAVFTVLISSQRARTLGRLQMEFAAGVSHELRTPLAVIRSAAHNLSSGVVRDKEGVEQYAAIVQEEARRLSDMVEEVLLYSETQSGRKKYSLQPTDVNEVIDRAITHLSPAIDLENSEFITRIDPDLPPVKADTGALTQCVQNLLSNALKYGKSGDKAQIEIVGQKDEKTPEVRLSVVDHGPGIDSADQRHLFEPFYRGIRVEPNVSGNGLGLHLVKRIMQAQGGRVTFSPAPNGGACFTLHIPAAV